MMHVQSNKVKHPHICVPCRKQWRDVDALQGHFKTAELHKHTDCNKCDINFETWDARFQHKIANQTAHFICIPCNMEWNGPEARQRHFETADVHEYINCTPCKLKFEDSSARLLHMK